MNENPVAWTETDFDHMSWHDNHVHGLQIRSGEDGFGEVVFDIDYILEWLPPVDGVHYRFRIAPATFTFRNVANLRLHVDYASHAVGPFSIGDVKRTPIDSQTGARYFEWNIDLNSPEGSASFHASGFAQVLRGPAQLTTAQWLDPPQRIPNDA
jgi:hypothetical protein